jgi:hypothetical protein
MAEKYLFEKFNQDRRIYNLNQGYWKRILQYRLKEKFSDENILFKNIDARGRKLYDANPIFTFINSQKTKAIRIIQDDTDLLREQGEFDRFLLSAWLDKILLNDLNENSITAEKEINELVIALFLTRETVEKTMKLILNWLNDDLNPELLEQIVNE